MSLTQSQIAIQLNVSRQTVAAHRKALEQRYGIQLAKQNGKAVLFAVEYLSLLEYSIKGKPLPADFANWHYPPSELIAIEQAIADVPATNTIIDGEFVADEPTVAIQKRETKVHQLVVPRAKFGLSRRDEDISALRQSSESSAKAIADTESLLEQLIAQDADAYGKRLGAIYEQVVLARVEEAKYDTAKKLLDQGE